MSELLTTDSVPRYLREVGLLQASQPAAVVELAGGVSNTVLGIRSDAGSWVVKQSLPKLRVAADWSATQERTLTEAAAITLVRSVSPEAVPEVVFVDPSRYVLVIDWIDDEHLPWKQLLLSTDPRSETAAALGSLLATWHTAFAGDEAALARVDAPQAFEQLRVDPFYRTVARRLPETADTVEKLIKAMSERAMTLVHGDFSPKNILVRPDHPSCPVVIDFEVAHRGDPTFDVAFLLAHLTLKALHRPEVRAELVATARAFVVAYDAGTANAHWSADDIHLHRHLGALLLSRTDGKSPADYLTLPQREAARAHGRHLLLDPSETDLFDPPVSEHP